MDSRDIKEFRHKGKETTIIYQEADGIMIYTQRKDRKNQIQKYKKEHQNEEVLKSRN